MNMPKVSREKLSMSPRQQITEEFVAALANLLLGEKIPLDIYDSQTGEVIIPAGRKIVKSQLRRMAAHHDTVEIDPSPIRTKIRQAMLPFAEKLNALRRIDQNPREIIAGLVVALEKAVEVMRDRDIDTELAGEFDTLFLDPLHAAGWPFCHPKPSQ